MRKIKFRGKTLYDKLMKADGHYELPSGSWVYGNLIIDHNGNPLIDIQGYNDGAPFQHQCWVDADTVGQFTGLQDKNGKDIYEGDIICFVDGLKRVNGKWIDNKHIYNVEYSGAAFRGVLGLSEVTDAVEVIGNIYDNPDLSKGGQP